MSILDELNTEHGHDIQQQLMSQLGLSQQQAAAVLPKLGPIILSGLKQRMDTHGEDHVQEHAQQLGTTDFSDIGALLSGGAQGGDPDLGGLLGGKGAQASQLMANKLGISAGTAVKLIPMVAPIIIGMLLKKGGSAGGASSTPGAGGGGLGGLGRILDRDGDGSILDDLGGLFSGGGKGGAASKTGCLSSLLGGLLKGRK
jgi:hypothetical protein